MEKKPPAAGRDKKREETCLIKIAQTPPMGWNSWDCYGAAVTEKEVRSNAEYIARHMRSHGWE